MVSHHDIGTWSSEMIHYDDSLTNMNLVSGGGFDIPTRRFEFSAKIIETRKETVEEARKTESN